MSAPQFYVDTVNRVSIAWSIAAAETFLYGSATSPLRVHLVMFGFYLHVLRTHGIAQHRFLAVSTILLFILGTAHCALQLATTILGNKAQLLEELEIIVEDTSLIDAAVHLYDVSSSLTEAASGIYVTSTIFVRRRMIFRCYMIWGCRCKIVILPIILTLAVAGLGYSNVQNNLVTDVQGAGLLRLLSSVATSLFTTFVLMGSRGGNTMCPVQEDRKSGSDGVTCTYRRSAHFGRRRTLVARISSLNTCLKEYCLEPSWVNLVASTRSPECHGTKSSRQILHSESNNPFSNVSPLSAHHQQIFPGAVLAQLVGIAPTIIAVRVGLGYSVENVDTFIAAAPPTRPPPQVIPGTPSVESLDDRVLYIHADGGKSEGV
ncbi:hypothetical protein C8R44DRAFT_753640 [Mycena epipterygia]|nr:hypothetical protein C8R44DRAFT_753640 [Mycena epipterygia]